MKTITFSSLGGLLHMSQEKLIRVMLILALLLVLGFAIEIACLFRWEIVAVGAGSGGSGGSNYDPGETGNSELGAYKLDRWTGEVFFYSSRYYMKTQYRR